MEYLRPSFSVSQPGKAINCCERCVYKNLKVPHAPDCKNQEVVVGNRSKGMEFVPFPEDLWRN